MRKAQGKNMDDENFLGDFPTRFAPLINEYCAKFENRLYSQMSSLIADGMLLSQFVCHIVLFYITVS